MEDTDENRLLREMHGNCGEVMYSTVEFGSIVCRDAHGAARESGYANQRMGGRGGMVDTR